jgi:glycerophosphoryl diester phosphodiesterase
MNIMDSKYLIGHRGFAGLRPENTLCGFRLAAEFGLPMVEYDVQLTKDLQWAVFHDRTLERLLSLHGTVADYTLHELSKFDAGLWYQPPYPGEFIPSLSEAYQAILDLGLASNIEIKVPPYRAAQHAREFAKFIASLDPSRPLPLVSSFDLECMILLRQLCPTLPIAYVVHQFADDSLAIAKEHNFQRIHCDVDYITMENIKHATAAKLPVYLYTVNQPQLAAKWLSHGVAGFFTDRADLLLQV